MEVVLSVSSVAVISVDLLFLLCPCLSLLLAVSLLSFVLVVAVFVFVVLISLPWSSGDVTSMEGGLLIRWMKASTKVTHIHIWNFLILGEHCCFIIDDDEDDGLLLFLLLLVVVLVDDAKEDLCAEFVVEIDIGFNCDGNDIGCFLLLVVVAAVDTEGIDKDVVAADDVDDDSCGFTEERFGLGDTGIVEITVLLLLVLLRSSSSSSCCCCR